MTEVNRYDLEDPEVEQFRWVLLVTIVAVLLFGFWASQSEIDQITRGQGEVVPSSRVQIIQAEDGGVLTSLPVNEGDRIAAGSLLALFDTTYADADFRDAEAKSISLEANLERLRAEVLGSEFKPNPDQSEYAHFYQTQEALFRRRTQALAEEVSAIQHVLSFLQKEIEINEPLVDKGDVSQTEILRLKRQEAELTASITNTRNRFFQEAQAEMARVEEEFERVRQLLVMRERALTQTRVIAPVEGLVTNIQFSTIGGVVRPGEVLMELVPLEDDLLIEAKIATDEIGFVRIGHPVSVKVDAFDYTIYGGLDGELIYISADAEQEDTPQGKATFYSVRVRTKGSAFSHPTSDSLTILPGMTASIEIKTGGNTILNYLLKPITKTLDEAFGER